MSRLASSTLYAQPAAAAAAYTAATDDAGFGGHLAGDGIDRTEGRQAPEAEDHFAVQGDPAADQPGVPPLGTIGTPYSPQSDTMRAISALEPGRTTTGVDPTNRPVQVLTDRWPVDRAPRADGLARPRRGAPRAARAGGAAAVLSAEHQPVALRRTIDRHRGPLGVAALQHRQGERIFDMVLDDPAQWARP